MDDAFGKISAAQSPIFFEEVRQKRLRTRVEETFVLINGN